MIIDIHAHFIPNLLYQRFDAHVAGFPEVRLLRDDKGKRLQFPGGEPTRPISPKLSDLADRRAWMDANGIDHQLVGGWLDSFGYELPAGEGLAGLVLQRLPEEELMRNRFTPLATVPLHGLAAEVLARSPAGFQRRDDRRFRRGAATHDPSLDPFLWRLRLGSLPAPDVSVRGASARRLRSRQRDRPAADTSIAVSGSYSDIPEIPR
jgi:aminocarboxymuconate-semialdehyde decarboxylase